MGSAGSKPGIDPGTWAGLGAAMVVFAVWALVHWGGDLEQRTAPGAEDRALIPPEATAVASAEEQEDALEPVPEDAPAAAPVAAPAAASTRTQPVPAEAGGRKSGSGLAPSWERDKRWRSAGELGEKALDMWHETEKLQEKTSVDPYRLRFQARTAADMLQQAVDDLTSLRKDYDHSRTAVTAIAARMSLYNNTLAELRKLQ